LYMVVILRFCRRRLLLPAALVDVQNARQRFRVLSIQALDA
jgi:hypothetical protein